MAHKNPSLARLLAQQTYTRVINTQIQDKVEQHRAEHPQKDLFVMAFGNTTQPVPQAVEQALVKAARGLGDANTYTGYEDIVGNLRLRQNICTRFYRDRLGLDLNEHEVFICDGAQSVVVDLQDLVANHSKVAIPDSAYPAFVD